MLIGKTFFIKEIEISLKLLCIKLKTTIISLKRGLHLSPYVASGNGEEKKCYGTFHTVLQYCFHKTKNTKSSKMNANNIQLLHFFRNLCIFKIYIVYACLLIIYYKLFRISRICREMQRISVYSSSSIAAATSKMKLVVTIVVIGWHPWGIITKCSILDVAAVIDPPQHLQSIGKEFFELALSKFFNLSIVLYGWIFSWKFSKNLKRSFLQKEL